jgi:hypothetical protein
MALLIRARLIEPVPAPEYFVSGLGRIEPIGGGNYRFLLYSNQPLTEDPEGPMQRVVTLRVVGHADGIPEAMAQLFYIIGKRVH